jgi:hypothetical protein
MRAERTATATVEVEAEPATTMALVADAARIPQWAPGFADAVRVEGDGAVSATKDERRFALRVRVDLDAGSVDLLRVVAPGVDGGAHVRVAPRVGGGSVVDMTVPVPADGDSAATATTVHAELTALAELLASGSR